MRLQKYIPFDKTGRSGLINLCLKPISVVISLIYTPILLGYLGDEKYGLWATLLSIINWVNYFDVGIGNGLRNVLAKEISEHNKREAQKSISTAYIVLTIISSIMLIIVIIVIGLVNWNNVFSTQIDMRVPMVISFTMILVNFVLSLINTVLFSLQRSEIIAVCNCVVQVINLLGVIVMRNFSGDKLINISILFGSSAFWVHICSSVILYKRFSCYRPKFTLFSKNKVKSICSIGIKFFVIQLMGIALFTVDDILITHFYGASQVTPFSITNRVFNTAYSAFAAFMVPFWSRSTVAFAQKDYSWLKSTIKKVFTICVVFILGYSILALLFKPIANIWLQRELAYPIGLIPVMGLFYSLFSVLCVECQFINGSGQINVQMISYIIIGLVNIPLSIYMATKMNLGVVGIRLATTILVLLEVIILWSDLKRIVRATET